MGKNVIEVIARGVCVMDGKLLLCRTRGAANTYLPGGHVEFGETAAASLAREVDEELGVRADVRRFLGAIEHSYDRKGQLQHEVNLVFGMTCRGLKPDRRPESCEDYIEFMWVPLKRISRSCLEPAPLRNLIQKWVAGRKSSACWSSTM